MDAVQNAKKLKTSVNIMGKITKSWRNLRYGTLSSVFHISILQELYFCWELSKTLSICLLPLMNAEVEVVFSCDAGLARVKAVTSPLRALPEG